MGAFIALAPLLGSAVPPLVDLIKGLIAQMQADPATTADQKAALDALVVQLDATVALVQAVPVWTPPPAPGA